MKYLRMMFLALALILLFSATACANQTAQKPHHGTNTQTPVSQLEINFQASPDHPAKNQSSILRASIRSDTAPVKNAEVDFEVWKEGQNHQMLSAKQLKDGVYEAAHTFSEEGQYNVIVHVMTPTIHQMINGTVIVGNSAAQTDHHHGGQIPHKVH